MRRKGPPAVVCAPVAAWLVLLGFGACHADLAGVVVDVDAALPAAEAGEVLTLCPAAIEAGETCAQPRGTTCEVGGCGDNYFVCTDGRWLPSEAPPATHVCPAQAPAQAEACPRCFPLTVSCGYGCEGDASGLVALCIDREDGRTWQLRERECPRFDGGSADAGADGEVVDAAPDAEPPGEDAAPPDAADDAG